MAELTQRIMGSRGPAPTPTAILNMRGSHRGKDRKNEPTCEGTPKRPSALTGDAVKVWKRLTSDLEAMGVLGKIDGGMLSRYCRLSVEWWELNAYLEANGKTYSLKDDAGNNKCVMPRPEVSMRHEIGRQMTAIESRFGMSPADRARLQVAKSESEDDGYEELRTMRMAQ